MLMLTLGVRQCDEIGGIQDLLVLSRCARVDALEFNPRKNVDGAKINTAWRAYITSCLAPLVRYSPYLPLYSVLLTL